MSATEPEARQQARPPRTLSWCHGVAMAPSIPLATFAVTGYSIGVIGALAAAALWAAACGVGHRPKLHSFAAKPGIRMLPADPSLAVNDGALATSKGFDHDVDA